MSELVRPMTDADGTTKAPVAWPRLLAVCVALTGLVFVQDAGQIATDTKLDLTADPWGFLARALHLWEPDGFFGQVQNQAYGYLFPTGPFFGLGEAVGLPEWVVQRLWWSGLLCAAFVGVERVAAALGIGTPWTRIIAGIGYALSPRMLTVIGPTSVEVLPMAMAPWIVLPLIRAAQGASIRRAAARSGIAVLLCGGVNAVATGAALVPAALYLLTRRRGARRWRLTGWWILSVVLATVWWAVPLLLLGRYSPPFLDWIESASVTTAITSIAATLRGTSQWVAYLSTPVGPELRAGWQLITVPAVVLHTAVASTVGLAGLALPRLRERRWLLLCVLVGLFAVTAGHTGAAEGAVATELQAALDGVLAPLRNTHKFDLVLRLPLALGVAHALAWCAAAFRRTNAAGAPVVPGVVRVCAVALLGVVMLGYTAPVISDRLAPSGSYEAIPGYWSEVADWLGERGAEGRALVVPGASFGTYVWGRTRDEPLQPLASSPWAVRDAVPLTPAGTIRALDAVQRRLVSGQGSAGLATMLGRMGVAYLVVRNDLDTVASSAPFPVVVHAALDSSPGLRPAATFGPDVGEGPSGDLMVDEGLDVRYPAVEVWSVTSVRPTVELVSVDQVVEVVGGPESLLDLSDRGLAAGRPTVLSGDRPPFEAGFRVVADGMRRREDNFGAVDHSTSFTLTMTDPLRRSAASRDYLPFEGFESVARWIGVDDVAVSSSRGDADSATGVEPASQPFAAMDGDPTTAWTSSGDGAVGEWLEVRFAHPVVLTDTSVRLARDSIGTVPSRIAVTTDAGTARQYVRPDVPILLDVPAEPVRRLRLTLLATSTTGPGLSFAIGELDIPAARVSRTIEPPDVVGSAAYLTTADGASPSCVSPAVGWVCSVQLGLAGEESVLDRVVRLEGDGHYRLQAAVLPRPGPDLNDLLDRGWTGVRVTSTTSAVDDPAARPQVVVDQDPATGWRADDLDLHPGLTVSLAHRRAITGLRITVADTLNASAPTSVEVSSPAGTRTGRLSENGTVEFEPLLTDEVTIRFPTLALARSYNREFRRWTQLPVGVSELVLTGARDLLRAPPPWRTIRVECGDGPSVQVGDRVVDLAVTTTAAAVLAGDPVPATSCEPGEPATSGGLVRVRIGSTPAWSPRSVDLSTAEQLDDGALAQPVDIESWQANNRVVSIGDRTRQTLLVVRENTNDGWVARMGGEVLQPVVVDGWQQGWLVPAGEASQITLEYRPDPVYRGSLLAGAAAVAILLMLAGPPGRGRRTTQATPPVAEPARLTSPTVAVTAAALLWLTGGWWGVAAVALGWGGLLPLRPARRPVVAAGAAATLGLLAAGLLAAGPWGAPGFAGNDLGPQLACLAALGLVVGAVAEQSRRPGLHRHA